MCQVVVTTKGATAEEADDICRICRASWREAYRDVLPSEYVEANVRLRYKPERIAGQIEENDGTPGWLVALDDGESERREGTDKTDETDQMNETVVGVIRGDRPEPGVGEIFSLYVHPDRQGEGVGSALLTALTERQRERGATDQWVYVFADHDDAIGFYDSKGFDTDNQGPAATVDGVDPDCDAVRLSRSI